MAAQGATHLGEASHQAIRSQLTKDEKKEKEKLKGFVDRILKLKESAADINADIKGVYDEAADSGFDRKALKIIVKEKRQEMSQELRQNVNQYCLHLDMPTIYRQIVN